MVGSHTLDKYVEDLARWIQDLLIINGKRVYTSAYTIGCFLRSIEEVSIYYSADETFEIANKIVKLLNPKGIKRGLRAALYIDLGQVTTYAILDTTIKRQQDILKALPSAINVGHPMIFENINSSNGYIIAKATISSIKYIRKFSEFEEREYPLLLLTLSLATRGYAISSIKVQMSKRWYRKIYVNLLLAKSIEDLLNDKLSSEIKNRVKIIPYRRKKELIQIVENLKSRSHKYRGFKYCPLTLENDT